jgi:hypothetical protein
MKKIHVLPTDKLSRLSDCHNNKLHLDDVRYLRNYQNIYITSDEEIKEGDWCLPFYNYKVDVTEEYPIYKMKNGDFYSQDKKIILTTDQDLIKDGVQAIDDEFLEWFVKNPSCEFVEVMNDTLTVGEMSKLPLGTRNHKYKIIIPQEEPKPFKDEILWISNNPQCKQIESCYNSLSKKCICPKEEPFEMYKSLYGKSVKMNDRFESEHIWSEELALRNKGRWIPQEYHLNKGTMSEAIKQVVNNQLKQETLEEAAEKLYLSHENNELLYGHSEDLQLAYKAGILDGAKWQAERMYSEEEVLELLKEREWYFQNPENIGSFFISVKKWFEQFKK